MHKALTYIVLLFCTLTMSAQPADTLSVIAGKRIPVEGAFLTPLEERDSVLIADQLVYGFELKGVEEGTLLALPKWENDERGGVQAVSSWTMDTVKVSKSRKGMPRLMDIRAGFTITSFDEGNYELPSITVGRLSKDGVLDTLVFDPMRLEVKAMPVDTATFVPHDIKAQIRYPLTFDEVSPWLLGFWILAMLIIAAICLMIMHRRKDDPAYVRKDPAHIVALRRLDKYRGSKMWAPEQQKAFYSGVTDTLREYMDSRYGISAMEMTTAEIFRDMKSTEVSAELLGQVKELFERADFVKFAKYVASDEDNASVLPLAVRFVTETYQSDIEAADEAGESPETIPGGDSPVTPDGDSPVIPGGDSPVIPGGDRVSETNGGQE